ncbi:YckD family protein [Peribacillus sp. SCS-155]|uniref:YckD family protein n=1 Tax=Peribacillus sedimenti TaxID=3115297 RepID=UPI003905ACE1
MKKTIFSLLILAALIFSPFELSANAQLQEAPSPQKPAQLTDGQKKQLEEIHLKLLEDKKQMVRKYAEFGIIPQEKADRMIQHFEDHYNLMQKNGFILPHHPHHFKKWHNKQNGGQ